MEKNLVTLYESGQNLNSLSSNLPVWDSYEPKLPFLQASAKTMDSLMPKTIGEYLIEGLPKFDDQTIYQLGDGKYHTVCSSFNKAVSVLLNKIGPRNIWGEFEEWGNTGLGAPMGLEYDQLWKDLEKHRIAIETLKKGFTSIVDVERILEVSQKTEKLENLDFFLRAYYSQKIEEFFTKRAGCTTPFLGTTPINVMYRHWLQLAETGKTGFNVIDLAMVKEERILKSSFANYVRNNITKAVTPRCDCECH